MPLAYSSTCYYAPYSFPQGAQTLSTRLYSQTSGRQKHGCRSECCTHGGRGKGRGRGRGGGGTLSCLHFHPRYPSVTSRCVGCMNNAQSTLTILMRFCPPWPSGSCSVFSICTTASAPFGTGAPAGTTGKPYQAVARGPGGGAKDCEPQTRYWEQRPEPSARAQQCCHHPFL